MSGSDSVLEELGFWGVQVPAGGAATKVGPPEGLALRISSAALGGPLKGDAAVALVVTGKDKKELYVAHLNKDHPSVSLDLFFVQPTTVKAVGNASIHLTGYTTIMEFGGNDDEGDEFSDSEDEDGAMARLRSSMADEASDDEGDEEDDEGDEEGDEEDEDDEEAEAAAAAILGKRKADAAPAGANNGAKKTKTDAPQQQQGQKQGGQQQQKGQQQQQKGQQQQGQKQQQQQQQQQGQKQPQQQQQKGQQQQGQKPQQGKQSAPGTPAASPNKQQAKPQNTPKPQQGQKQGNPNTPKPQGGKQNQPKTPKQ